jgi:hypothetical protein
MFDVTSIEVMVISMYVVRLSLIHFDAPRRGTARRGGAHG